MQRLIKNSGLQAVLVLAAVFFFASFAQANTGDHSHHVKVVSPFDKVSSDKPLHCLLNSHLHQANQDCPHKANHSKKGKSTELRADCGSNPVNSEGLFFGGDLLKYTNTDVYFYRLVSQFLIPQTNDTIRSLPRSFERPPQLS